MFVSRLVMLLCHSCNETVEWSNNNGVVESSNRIAKLRHEDRRRAMKHQERQPSCEIKLGEVTMKNERRETLADTKFLDVRMCGIFSFMKASPTLMNLRKKQHEPRIFLTLKK